MIDEATWDEFCEAGLLWWVNRFLHVFGWSICRETVDGRTVRVFPARTEWRGFSAQDEAEGHRRLTQHLPGELPRLLKDVE